MKLRFDMVCVRVILPSFPPPTLRAGRMWRHARSLIGENLNCGAKPSADGKRDSAFWCREGPGKLDRNSNTAILDLVCLTARNLKLWQSSNLVATSKFSAANLTKRWPIRRRPRGTMWARIGSDNRLFELLHSGLTSSHAANCWGLTGER